MVRRVPGPRKARLATLGENVERLREARGLTQEELGRLAGLHQTAIARIEKGERGPRLATLFKLAEGLGVRPGELFDGID